MRKIVPSHAHPVMSVREAEKKIQKRGDTSFILSPCNVPYSPERKNTICIEPDCKNLSYSKKGEYASLFCKKHLRQCSVARCSMPTFQDSDVCQRHYTGSRCRYLGGYVCPYDAKSVKQAKEAKQVKRTKSNKGEDQQAKYCEAHSCPVCSEFSSAAIAIDHGIHETLPAITQFPCFAHLCPCKKKSRKTGHACSKKCEHSCEEPECSKLQGLCPEHSVVAGTPTEAVCGIPNCGVVLDIPIENYDGTGRCELHINKQQCCLCEKLVLQGTKHCRRHFCGVCRKFRNYHMDGNTCNRCHGFSCSQCGELVDDYEGLTPFCRICRLIDGINRGKTKNQRENMIKVTILESLRKLPEGKVIDIALERKLPNGLRPDILIEYKRKYIVVEIDEDSHTTGSYSFESEAQRPKLMQMCLNKPVKFLRIGTNDMFDKDGATYHPTEKYHTVMESIDLSAVDGLTIVNYPKDRRKMILTAYNAE